MVKPRAARYNVNLLYYFVSSLTFRKLLHIVTDLIKGKNICAYIGRPLYVVYYFCR